MKKAIEQYHTNKTRVQRLMDEKATQDAKMKALKLVYAQLQRELKAQTFILESTQEKLREVYNRINSLKKEVVELKESKEAFKGS